MLSCAWCIAAPLGPVVDHVPCSQLLLSQRDTDPLAAVSAAQLEGILAQLYDACPPPPRDRELTQAKATCMNFILMTFCW